MRTFAVSILVSLFCLNAHAEIERFECSYAASSPTAERLEYLIDVGHKSAPALISKINEIKAELGYAEIGLFWLSSCSNENSENIDFELLRGAILSRLEGQSY